MTSPAIETLSKSFPSEQLLLAGTEECKEVNKSYLSCLESDLTPAAIFVPKNVDDVAKFVETIGPFAVDGTMPFASKYLPSYCAKQKAAHLSLRSITFFCSAVVIIYVNISHKNWKPQLILDT